MSLRRGHLHILDAQRLPRLPCDGCFARYHLRQKQTTTVNMSTSGSNMGFSSVFLSFFLSFFPYLMRGDVMEESLSRVRPLSVHTACNPNYISERHKAGIQTGCSTVSSKQTQSDNNILIINQAKHFFSVFILTCPAVVIADGSLLANSTKLLNYWCLYTRVSVKKLFTESLWVCQVRLAEPVIFCLSRQLAACAFKYARGSFTTLADTAEQLYGSSRPHVLSSHGRPSE